MAEMTTTSKELEAPERLWIDARIITTPSMRVLHGEPPPEGVNSVEYVRADLSRAAVAAPQGDDDYVAWCCYDFANEETAGTTIRMCDSDTPGAFKVFRASPIPEQERFCIHCGRRDTNADYCGKRRGLQKCEFPAATPVTTTSEHPYFAHARTCTSCDANGLCAEGLRLYNDATTTTAAEHERCNVSVTGQHRLVETYCKDCGQTFAANTVAATSGARACAEEIREWIGISGMVDGEGLNELTAIISKHFPSAVPVEEQTPHCWHCGIELEPTELRLRCDQCSADCDDEMCNAYGCAPRSTSVSGEAK